MLRLSSRRRRASRRGARALLTLCALTPLGCGQIIGDEGPLITHDAGPSDLGDAGDAGRLNAVCTNACAAPGALACGSPSGLTRCEVDADGCTRWKPLTACGAGTMCCDGACVAVGADHCFTCGAACRGETPACSASLGRCGCTEDACRASSKTCDTASGACVACRDLATMPLAKYDGSLGFSKAFAEARGASVGLLRWRSDLASRFADPGEVNGRAWCTGVLVGAGQLLTAAHCVESGVDRGLRWPHAVRGVDLSPGDAARGMQVQLRATASQSSGPDAGSDPDASAPAASDETYDVLDVVELRRGGFDYAVLQLAGAPGARHGYARIVGPRDPSGTLLLLGFLANERPTLAAVNDPAAVGHELHYDGVGDDRAADGSPIFDTTTGMLVGLHLASRCSPTGPGSIGVPLALARPTSPVLRSIVLGRHDDLDGDGDADLIVHDATAGRLDAWLLDDREETRRAVRPLSEPLPAGWLLGPRADFDGDGRLDLVVHDPTSGEMRILYLGGADGTTVTKQGVMSWNVAGDTWRMRGVADFDNDGRPDILWRNVQTGQANAWFLGDPDGRTIVRATDIGPPRDAGWELGGAGDFDRDAVDDLLWLRLGDGLVETWTLGGTSRMDFRTQELASWTAGADTPWRPFRVSDWNEDGWVDILWIDQQTGQVGPWYLGGSSGMLVTRSDFVDPSLDVAGGASISY